MLKRISALDMLLTSTVTRDRKKQNKPFDFKPHICPGGSGMQTGRHACYVMLFYAIDGWVGGWISIYRSFHLPTGLCVYFSFLFVSKCCVCANIVEQFYLSALSCYLYFDRCFIYLI